MHIPCKNKGFIDRMNFVNQMNKALMTNPIRIKVVNNVIRVEVRTSLFDTYNAYMYTSTRKVSALDTQFYHFQTIASAALPYQNKPIGFLLNATESITIDCNWLNDKYWYHIKIKDHKRVKLPECRISIEESSDGYAYLNKLKISDLVSRN